MAHAIRRRIDSTEILRLAAIVESSEDAIIGKNLQGIVETWNDGAEKLYGFSRAEMCGNPMSILLPPDRRDEEARILRAIQAGESVRHFETVRIRRGGGRVDVSLTISPIFDSAGTVVGASHVARDISEKTELKEDLRQMQKLAGLGALAAGIAHEFNNLHAGILASAGSSLGALPGSSPARAGLLDVVRGSERAAAFTRQILAYAGKGRHAVESLNVADVVREISRLIEALIPRHVYLSLELDPALPSIEGDAGQLEQLILNLVINGVEAIGDNNGSITVRASRQRIPGHMERGASGNSRLPPGHCVVLEVSDTGCGMDETTQARMFDPFFSTKLCGRGLGLAAVNEIVRGHHGELAAFSAPGQGSTFRVLLPGPAGRTAGPSTGDSARSSGGSGHVLVVDDEEMIRTFAGNALEKLGYTVTIAADGQDAVGRFARDPHAFDLVFLDLTMPAMNGEEVFHSLRELRPDVPVLLSSGLTETLALRGFAGKGLGGFIQKPYSVRSLADHVKAALCCNGH